MLSFANSFQFLFKRTVAAYRSALIHSQRESWVAWHEQREKELQMQRGKTDSWSYSSKQQTASGGTRASATAHASAAGPDSARTTKRIPYVNPADYYALLGLSEKRHLATLDEIRSAFRRQLMQFHPDRCEAEGYDKDEASARTRELYDAFAVLRDPVKRAAFDRKAAW